MSTTRQIIERRLKEAEPAKPELEKEPDRKSGFEALYDKIHAKIDRKPASAKLLLYRALLKSLLEPIASAGANKTKLNVAAREFLKDFEKHAKR